VGVGSGLGSDDELRRLVDAVEASRPNDREPPGTTGMEAPGERLAT
jgi:hypothetical protein